MEVERGLVAADRPVEDPQTTAYRLASIIYGGSSSIEFWEPASESRRPRA